MPHFRIAYQNVRGLRFKLSSLSNCSFDFEFDGIAFAGTWLNCNIFDSEVMSINSNIYRRDRRFTNGGGVLISICFKYTSELTELRSSEDIYLL